MIHDVFLERKHVKNRQHDENIGPVPFELQLDFMLFFWLSGIVWRLNHTKSLNEIGKSEKWPLSFMCYNIEQCLLFFLLLLWKMRLCPLRNKNVVFTQYQKREFRLHLILCVRQFYFKDPKPTQQQFYVLSYYFILVLFIFMLEPSAIVCRE